MTRQLFEDEKTPEIYAEAAKVKDITSKYSKLANDRLQAINLNDVKPADADSNEGANKPGSNLPTEKADLSTEKVEPTTIPELTPEQQADLKKT